MADIVHRDALTYQLVYLLVKRKEAGLSPLPLREAYQILAQRFNLSAAELGQANLSDNSNKWEMEVRFVCTELRKSNVLKRLHAKLELTDQAYHKMKALYDMVKRSQKNTAGKQAANETPAAV